MLHSMTGFGRGESKYAGGKLRIELKAVNQRYYELSARMPGYVSFLEDRIRQHINLKIRRGRVSLNLIAEALQEPGKALVVNKALASKYFMVLKELKRQLKIEEPIGLSHLMALPEVVTYQYSELDSEKLWKSIKIALDAALGQLIEARKREGAALYKDISGRIDKIEEAAKKIKDLAPASVLEYKKSLQEKIKKIAPDISLEPGRLEQETAIIAKNCDMSEEVVRIFSHIKNFKAATTGSLEAGRRMDFIAQELFREVNTICAKSADTQINTLAIQIKEELEKIREQAQNIE